MPKKPSVKALKPFVRRIARQYLQDENVTSVGVGYKTKAGQRTRVLSIQFTVGQKAVPEMLESIGTKPLPKSFRVDGVDVPTDVEQRDFGVSVRALAVEAASDRKRAIDPVVPGVSIGHPSISAGTAGCVVYDASSGQPYVLSNWHVLNGATGKPGDDIVQPGRHDDNRIERNKVGKLVRSHLGLAGDCAVATIERRGLSDQIHDLSVSVRRIGDPELGDRVVKSGRTTDVTYGIVKRVHVTSRINYGAAGVQTIGGFEIGPDPANPAADGEISMGGDSGSAWVLVKGGVATDMMLGLHFAGESGNAPEHALACYAGAVFQKLQITPAKPLTTEVLQGAAAGYDPEFLGLPVPVPEPVSGAVKTDLAKIEGRHQVDYTHFSLALSRSRRFARWVAWNIDGHATHRLPRKGIPFKKDPKVPADLQVGNELYAGNRLDRGHIARRQDLLWGTLEEARRANVDSFYYTNMTPQHEGFNQSGAGGLWGELENQIYADAEVHAARLSVMGGPILRTTDKLYRGIRIPRDFWKIVYFRESATGPLRAKAFVLTQQDLLSQIELLELDEFRVYEVPLSRLAELTGLGFAAGSAPESLPEIHAAAEEVTAAGGVRLVRSAHEILGH